MFKTNSLILIVLFCLGATFASAQPEMTLWRVFGHDHEANPPEFYTCGGYYYFVTGEEASVQTLWSIKNEGTTPLKIQLPLSLHPDSAPFYSITSQPSQEVLGPGEETHFALQYTKSESEGFAFLEFQTNDPATDDCGLLLNGGKAGDPCLTRFTEDSKEESKVADVCPDECLSCWFIGGQIVEICEKDGYGFGTDASGIPLNEGPCQDYGENFHPISISDPCLCENLAMIDSRPVFSDVLSITGLNGTPLYLTSNAGDEGSFMDINGDDIEPFVFIGTIPLEYTFYRLPGTTLDILINGERFRSTCNEEPSNCSAIPTMSQWALFILSLILMTAGVVRIHSARRVIIDY